MSGAPPPIERSMIVLNDVSKFYGEVLGVNKINLSIPPGIAPRLTVTTTSTSTSVGSTDSSACSTDAPATVRAGTARRSRRCDGTKARLDALGKLGDASATRGSG